MKIILVTHRFFPNIGGIELHVYELARRLAEEHDVWVYSADKSQKLGDSIIEGIHQLASHHPSQFSMVQCLTPAQAYLQAHLHLCHH